MKPRPAASAAVAAGYSGTPLAKKLGIGEGALPIGLVDVKVCAVDAVWSGLKLVIRKENRASR